MKGSSKMLAAENINQYQYSEMQVFNGSQPAIDPFALVKDELDSVSSRLRRTVMTEIPRLGQAADYFFQLGSEGSAFFDILIASFA